MEHQLPAQREQVITRRDDACRSFVKAAQHEVKLRSTCVCYAKVRCWYT